MTHFVSRQKKICSGDPDSLTKSYRKYEAVLSEIENLCSSIIQCVDQNFSDIPLVRIVPKVHALLK